jgi:hypothetical protein
MDIRHDKRLSAGNRGAADAATRRNAGASGVALKWAQNEFILRMQKIEASPVDVRQRGKDQRCGVGGIGDEIPFAGQQPGERLGELPI